MSPRLTYLLILANVLVFLLVFSMPEAMQEYVFELLSFSAAGAFQPWKWFTSLFMHVSASHLFFNMLGLYFFGKILEKEVPAQWFLGIFFVAGLLGNFAFMFTSPSPVVGASGAMFGVMGAAMFLSPLKKVYLYVFPLPLAVVAIAFTVFESFVVYFQPEEFIGNDVANIAHVAGIITGAVFAFFHAPKKSLKGSLVLLFALLLLILLSPLFALVAGIGGAILSVLDYIIGLVLYNLAGMLSFLWV